MSKEVVLDDKYRQIPAGWVSQEWVDLGTVRMIDGALHYAGYRHQGTRYFRTTSETHWWPVK